MKKEVLITLKTNEQVQKYKVNIELNNNIYRYRETTEKNTLVEFDSNKNILKREDQDLSMEYLFILGEKTIGKIYIKNINKYLDIVIRTTEITKKDSNIKIKYYLENDLYEYRIDME